MEKLFPPRKRPRIDPEEISSDEDLPGPSTKKVPEDVWRSINDETVVKKVVASLDRTKYTIEGFEAKFNADNKYLGQCRCVGFCTADNKPFRCVDNKSQQNLNFKRDLSKLD